MPCWSHKAHKSPSYIPWLQQANHSLDLRTSPSFAPLNLCQWSSTCIIVLYNHRFGAPITWSTNGVWNFACRFFEEGFLVFFLEILRGFLFYLVCACFYLVSGFYFIYRLCINFFNKKNLLVFRPPKRTMFNLILLPSCYLSQLWRY